ncbi:cytochrome c-type biogenesis protein CcmH/NrfF [Parabacteroides sp. PFB2-12]|uniref:hypothetical protein n=1 Tax=unclassified Parabacteroides TaxID=2649774 RepID=UPI0024746520|nr:MULTISPECIES: hypothetical protein [unclassified Parabacteroides]MDH6341893.1 cytochrome c-type biogenesis protein CcmH/NrfF [Parabacteroides sp. PM6-13]MDH6389591.1 cytochrome c-type biogenesis protein CcmH/NrfF [Parabacteroides sp. PFB2-12]
MTHINYFLWRNTLLFSLLMTLALVGCQKEQTASKKKEQPKEKETHPMETSTPVRGDNAIYYWKTTFRFAESDSLFLADHNIKRLYLRYFDVVDENNDAVPNATLRFIDPIPRGVEIIPTVFLEHKLFTHARFVDTLPELLLQRIRTMSETHDIGPIREIQIDCDWTKGTEQPYFMFLEKLRDLLIKERIRLSVTIRLHQLNMPVPPADHGILMCYNTGSVRDYLTVNSILSARDVAPYAHRLKDYTLPLDVGYPAFSWAVCFENKAFRFLLRGLSPDHPNLQQKKDNLYIVTTDFEQEEQWLSTGMEIRFEKAEMQEIMASQALIEPQLDRHSVLLYHLDSTQLSNYTPDEIKRIYNYSPVVVQ